jgi:hypothetical protein
VTVAVGALAKLQGQRSIGELFLFVLGAGLAFAGWRHEHGGGNTDGSG